LSTEILRFALTRSIGAIAGADFIEFRSSLRAHVLFLGIKNKGQRKILCPL